MSSFPFSFFLTYGTSVFKLALLGIALTSAFAGPVSFSKTYSTQVLRGWHGWTPFLIALPLQLRMNCSFVSTSTKKMVTMFSNALFKAPGIAPVVTALCRSLRCSFPLLLDSTRTLLPTPETLSWLCSRARTPSHGPNGQLIWTLPKVIGERKQLTFKKKQWKRRIREQIERPIHKLPAIS